MRLPDRAELRARFTGKSWWRLRFTDGRVVNEWDTDWSKVPQQGRQAIRLYCPNGEIAELGSGDCSGRLFQLKVALLQAGSRGAVAHIVGLVNDVDGNCSYAAWEYDRQRLVTGRDNVHAMAYQQVGRLSFDVMGLRF